MFLKQIFFRWPLQPPSMLLVVIGICLTNGWLGYPEVRNYALVRLIAAKLVNHSHLCVLISKQAFP